MACLEGFEPTTFFIGDDGESLSIPSVCMRRDSEKAFAHSQILFASTKIGFGTLELPKWDKSTAKPQIIGSLSMCPD
jgi:hypothetical protein